MSVKSIKFTRTYISSQVDETQLISIAQWMVPEVGILFDQWTVAACKVRVCQQPPAPSTDSRAKLELVKIKL